MIGDIKTMTNLARDIELQREEVLNLKMNLLLLQI